MLPDITRGADAIVKRAVKVALASACAGGLLAIACAAPARAHPHIFAEAMLEVRVSETGEVETLRHTWRFDDLFSSTVLLQFDQNGDLELDEKELEFVGDVIRESLKEFGYFQVVHSGGRSVSMKAPETLSATFEEGQLVIAFESAPIEALALEGTVDFGVYDPTFYTAIDFYDEGSLRISHLPEGCGSSIVRPNPDEAIAMNQQSLTDAFFADPTEVDYSKLFATRLEVDCTARG